MNTYMRAMAARLSGKSLRGLENLAKAGEKGTCSRKESENVENGGLEGSNSLHVLVILRKVLKSYPSHSRGRLEIA